ncbi:MAG: hypothetical protein V1826_01135 [bacterium]
MLVEGNRQEVVSIRTLTEKLKLPEKQLGTLVQRVVEAMLVEWATPERAIKQPFYGHMWGTALAAIRAFLPDNKPLLKQVLRVCVVYCGGNSKHPRGLVADILPGTMCKGERKSEAKWEAVEKAGLIDALIQATGYAKDDINAALGVVFTKEAEGSGLQDVVNYLMSEVGFSLEEVQNMWLEMLDLRIQSNFLTWCITEWYRGTELFTYKVKGRREKVSPIAQRLVMMELKRIFLNGVINWDRNRSGGRAPEWYLQHIDSTINDIDYELKSRHCHSKARDRWIEQVEELFVHSIAQGHMSTAFYMLARFGEPLGICNKDDANAVDLCFDKLARAAIAAAEQARNFGVASALAEHLGETAEADRLRELARKMDQRVAFKHPLVFTAVEHVGIG